MMQRIIALCGVLFLGACATTGMYDAPDSGSAAVLKVVNMLDEGGKEQATSGGWTMPSMHAPARVGLFTIDGDRLDETGGDQQALVSGGKHQLQIFADDAGMLRFRKFSLKVEAGHEYQVRIMRNADGADRYRAQVVDAADPQHILKEVTF